MRDNGSGNSGLDLYLAMSAAWWSRVPVALVHEPPAVLARILDLGLRAEGISQSDLQQELGINQSRMSKLTKKLVDENLLSVNQSSNGSNGRKSMTATVAARKLIASLRVDMEALVPAKRAGPVSSRQPKPFRPGIRKRITTDPAQVPFKLE
jgi:hypothetical protein